APVYKPSIRLPMSTIKTNCTRFNPMANSPPDNMLAEKNVNPIITASICQNPLRYFCGTGSSANSLSNRSEERRVWKEFRSREEAEDGIRYRNVTGVQTCALPILNRA